MQDTTQPMLTLVRLGTYPFLHAMKLADADGHATQIRHQASMNRQHFGHVVCDSRQCKIQATGGHPCRKRNSNLTRLLERGQHCASPASTPAWTAAPRATTSSGFTVRLGALPLSRCTSSCIVCQQLVNKKANERSCDADALLVCTGCLHTRQQQKALMETNTYTTGDLDVAGAGADCGLSDDLICK